MSLSHLKLKKIYRTKQNNVIDELLAPALKESIKYDRGAGYFTLSSLASLSDGLIPFIKSDGKMRVITSVQLCESDIEAIKNGSKLQKSDVVKKIHEKIEEEINNEDVLLKLDFITNLIAVGILNIKIAYLSDGIYHEKIGILTDDCGDKIYFSGSNNATASGLSKNWETIMLLTSWWGDNDLIQEQEEYFEKLWNDELEGIEVMSFPEAEKNNLILKYKVSTDVDKAIKRLQNNFVECKKEKSLYKYQEKAVLQFLHNDGNHFYEMATGTGKTYTAIQSIIALYNKQKKFSEVVSAVIIVPQIDLQSQWERAFIEEGVTPLLLGGNASANETSYNISAFMINSQCDDKLNVAIATYDTFFTKFIKQCESIGKRAIIVVDEAHNLSPNQINILPESFAYRLGLSATPERYSQEETDKIVSYFTRDKLETYKYTIDEAIENGFLSHYLYFPIFVHILNDDFFAYQKYTKQILYAKNQEPIDKKLIKDILTKRSSIIKKTSSKLEKLKEMVIGRTGENYEFKNSVVYCGHGKDYETEESIIDAVTKILAVDGRYSVSQFTSKTIDRDRVLRAFEDEDYDILVAIKCFDEGVDVPKLNKIYIMASDALSRQTIQRRGRVLRKCADTGKRIAYIYDFVALPPYGIEEGIGINSLVINEMKRAKEYARLSDNKTEIMQAIGIIMNRYGVVEEDFENELDTDVE